MSDTRRPITEAAQRLLDWLDLAFTEPVISSVTYRALREHLGIGAIETEAAAAERARIRPWIASIGATNLDTGRRIRKADVLAVLDGDAP
jgi:hypothetical protein